MQARALLVHAAWHGIALVTVTAGASGIYARLHTVHTGIGFSPRLVLVLIVQVLLAHELSCSLFF